MYWKLTITSRTGIVSEMKVNDSQDITKRLQLVTWLQNWISRSPVPGEVLTLQRCSGLVKPYEEGRSSTYTTRG